MSNLTVSNAVFGLLQAADQAGMQAAIGAGAPPFALAANDNVVTVSGQPAVALDSNGNPYLAQTNGDQHAEFYFDNNGNPAISNQETAQIFQVDGNGNPTIRGADSGDQVGFSPGGVASVTAAADGLQLPIARVVGTASGSYLGSAGPGGQLYVILSVTGSVQGDAVVANLQGSIEGFTGTGGLVILSAVVASAGVVGVFVGNTDLENTYTLANLSVYVLR